MLDIFAYAFVLGLAFNAAPGAVFAESLHRGLKGGFRPALAVQVGSLVGDALWAVLGLTGVGMLFQLPVTRVPLSVVGSAVLVGLGAQALRDAWRGRAVEAAASRDDRAALTAGALMSVGNPLNVIYWSGAAGTVAALMGEAPGTLHLATFLGGFMAASLAWCFVCAGLIAALRRMLSAAWVRLLETACGVTLVGCGLAMLWRTVMPHG